MSQPIIEFRAWSPKWKKLIYDGVDGYTINVHSHAIWMDACDDECAQLMQLVEVRRDGSKVFVGDILKAYRRDDKEKKHPVYSEVTMQNGCFMAFNCTWHEFYRLWQSDYEIAGNIYYNEKLLKKKK